MGPVSRLDCTEKIDKSAIEYSIPSGNFPVNRFPCKFRIFSFDDQVSMLGIDPRKIFPPKSSVSKL